jgi:hypothetical protein
MGVPRFRTRTLMIFVAVMALLCAMAVAFLKIDHGLRALIVFAFPILLAVPSLILGLASALADD